MGVVWFLRLAALFLAGLLATTVGAVSPTLADSAPTEIAPAVEGTEPTDPAPEADPVLVGAGDIAGCGIRRRRGRPPALLDEHARHHLPGGRHRLSTTAPPRSSAPCFEHHLGRAQGPACVPAVGNHEYYNGVEAVAARYFHYFGRGGRRARQGLVQLRARRLARDRRSTACATPWANCGAGWPRSSGSGTFSPPATPSARSPLCTTPVQPGVKHGAIPESRGRCGRPVPRTAPTSCSPDTTTATSASPCRVPPGLSTAIFGIRQFIVQRRAGPRIGPVGPAQQRGARPLPHVRRSEVDASRRQLRLAVRPGAREGVHRLRHRRLPRRTHPAAAPAAASPASSSSAAAAFSSGRPRLAGGVVVQRVVGGAPQDRPRSAGRRPAG